jgi:ATP-dependent Lhr-like helicase
VLYLLGDLSREEIGERCEGDAEAWLAELERAGRVQETEMSTVSGPARRWAPTESADAYRLAFGQQQAGAGESQEASREILRRFMRTHGPVTAADIRRRYPFGEGWLSQELQELTHTRELVRGQFTKGAGDVQWANRENLGELHRRSLALLRRQVEPVSLFTYADFLTRYQHLHPAHKSNGSDGLRRTLEQLRAFRLPAGLWERETLPGRVNGYAPELLDEQCESGDFMWIGQGSRDHLARAQAMFITRGEGSRLYAEMAPETELSPTAGQILEFMEKEGACFRQDLERALDLTPTRVQEGLIDLALAGLVTNDNFEALRNLLGHQLPQSRRPFSALEEDLSARTRDRVRRMPTPMAMRDAKRVVRARLRAVRPREGRWSLVRRTASWGRPVQPVEQVEAWARLLLLRYGILSRHCLAGEACPWTWADLYRWLQRMEMRGEVRRGYFVEGLPGAQFGLPEAVESLRDWQQQRGDEIIVLNAYDPANIFTPDLKALPTAVSGEPLVAARQASTYYVMERGRPCLVAEGSRVSSVSDASDDLVSRALQRLAAHVVGTRAPGLPQRFRISEWNGAPVLASGAPDLLESAGFHRRMRDMVWWQE